MINLAMTKSPEDISATITVPLDQLTAWEGNVRKTTNDNSIKELAESILSHGLLQPPVVRAAGDGAYTVIAGKRRLRALHLLAQDNRISADFPVTCHAITADDDADEISLVENVVREDMHPADQFEAFRTLAEKGYSLTDIAARFGVSETVIKKRLTLANLAPEILAAFRDDKLSLAMVQAFAVTDDHARQVKVFNDMDDDAEPEDIRGELTEGRIPATDKRVKFVTLGVYEQAGGIVSRDLFCTDENGIFIESPDLLDKLVTAQLEAEAESRRAQGWSWVDITVEGGWKYSQKHKLSEQYPDYEDQTPEAKAEQESLEAEAEKIETDSGERNYTPEEKARLKEIDDRIEELQLTPEIWTDEDRARFGVVLSLGHDGKLDATVYARPDADSTTKKSKTASSSETGNADGDQGDDDKEPVSGTNPLELPKDLVYILTAHRTAALADKLSEKPDLALAVAVHAMGKDFLYEDGFINVPTCTSLSAMDELNNLDDVDPDNCKGFAAMADSRAAWSGQIPDDVEEFWDWCLKQKRQKLLNLFAYLMGKTIDATCYNMKRLEEADALAEALELDMADYFTPTTENYFKHVGKTTILANLAEALELTEIPAAWQKMSQGKLAEIAEREIAGTGWIPEPLRAAPLTDPETSEDDCALEDGEKPEPDEVYTEDEEPEDDDENTFTDEESDSEE